MCSQGWPRGYLGGSQDGFWSSFWIAFLHNSAAFDKAWCQEDLEGTGKKRNSHEAEKNKEVTVKSREETKANREETSKAGKGPLKHHEENREGPGQKKREAQRASRAMSKHEEQ